MKNHANTTEGLESSAMKGWIRANVECLIKQSRSFAIPILNLDSRFMIPVMVQYNLNKAIDTIEDSTALEANEKIELIKSFCASLERVKYPSEVRKRMLLVTPPEESYVFQNCGSTINLYYTLSEEEKTLSRRWTTELAEGMCQFLTRPIRTLRDLNEYCYYVAGTVGIYLTGLLKLKGSNVSEKVYGKLYANAVSFGLFLQKLNIIRDFVEDKVEKGRSFWPQSYFEHEKDQVKVLNRMSHETLRNDVRHAIDYYTHIPPGNDSYDYFIRFILSSGMEYLKTLRNNESVFSREKVKLPKAFIKGLYAKVSSLTREEFETYCERLYYEEMASY